MDESGGRGRTARMGVIRMGFVERDLEGRKGARERSLGPRTASQSAARAISQAEWN